MKEKKYFLIDKNIIHEGQIFEFDIYFALRSSRDVKFFKDKSFVVTNDDIIIIII